MFINNQETIKHKKCKKFESVKIYLIVYQQKILTRYATTKCSNLLPPAGIERRPGSITKLFQTTVFWAQLTYKAVPPRYKLVYL